LFLSFFHHLLGWSYERHLAMLRRARAVRSFWVRLMKRVLLFAPAALCAGICFQALLFTARKDILWPRCLFYVFLPACFLLLAGAMIRMSREISRLRRRIGKLEAKAFSSPRPHNSGPGSEPRPGDADDGSDMDLHHSSLDQDQSE